MTDQWPASPVLGDVAEPPVLDLIPFTRSGWEVADGQHQARLTGQILQDDFPESRAVVVRAASVGRDQ